MYRPCDALGFSIKGVLMKLCKYVCYSGVIVHSGSVVGEIGLILCPDCKVSRNCKSNYVPVDLQNMRRLYTLEVII